MIFSAILFNRGYPLSASWSFCARRVNNISISGCFSFYRLFQKLSMFQSCIPDNAGTPWLLSKATYLSHMWGTDSLGANEVARDIYDMRPRSEKDCRTLVMFVDNRFQRQVCWHLSCLYFITFRLLALSGYPPCLIIWRWLRKQCNRDNLT